MNATATAPEIMNQSAKKVKTEIAVLLTTFNRKQKTLDCLESLHKQQLPDNVCFTVFLTDDGSKDGTADAVRHFYPDTNVYHGTGALYWAGGMRNSWKQALAANPDYYLLLNDDTVLTETAVASLLQSSIAPAERVKKPSIFVGSTVDAQTGKLSYGGMKLTSKIRLKHQTVHSETNYLHCDLANANIMLVPRQIVEKIGILSEVYTHGIADYDYTLKAKKAGFDVLVAPGFLGRCVDDHGNNWQSQKETLKKRISYLKSPKGLAYKEYLTFIGNHFPLELPEAFVKLWMKTLFPFLWTTFKKR